MAETTGTTNTRSSSGGTTRRSASRSTSRSTGTARKTQATKRNTTTKRNQTKSNTRAASRNTKRTTARTQTTAAREAAAARREAATVVDRFGDAAERAALTYLGATLVARDNVVEFVDTYSNRNKLQREVEKRLKRFERRGTTARNRFEREVKKTRTKLERELRQRTNRVERDVQALRTDARRVGKDLEKTALAQQIELAQERAANVAQGAALGVSKAARQVTGRAASTVS
jgi:hypothetical protein